MKIKWISLLIILFFPAVIMGQSFDHKINTGKMTFEWKVDGSNLNIKLKAKTKGWLGIGFNPTYMMKGANILIGSVKRGKAKVRDDYGTKSESHASDKKKGGKKNVSKISGSEKGRSTELMFTIPLNSGDKRDKPIDVSGETIVMLAYGKADSFRIGHKYVAILKVNLSTGKFSKVGR